jgi:hypothetical protein
MELKTMSYVQGLIDTNLKSLCEMLRSALDLNHISDSDIKAALEAESIPVPAGGDIYGLSDLSLSLLAKLAASPDRDMAIIVKKILRSTKYAAITFYAVSGADNNPHHLPVQRLEVLTQS